MSAPKIAFATFHADGPSAEIKTYSSEISLQFAPLFMTSAASGERVSAVTIILSSMLAANTSATIFPPSSARKVSNILPYLSLSIFAAKSESRKSSPTDSSRTNFFTKDMSHTATLLRKACNSASGLPKSLMYSFPQISPQTGDPQKFFSANFRIFYLAPRL